MEKHNAWGYHFILDCKECNASIKNKTHITKFIEDLINKIDMIAIGDPQIELLLPGTDNEGYSAMQMIATSNITAHFVNSTFDAYIDVFSCKEFDKDVVIKAVNEYFNPSEIKKIYLIRNAR
jgi:S-adenosylmethionine/arginine decarboxylase-like enzyme